MMFDRSRVQGVPGIVTRLASCLCTISILFAGIAASAVTASPDAFTDKQPDGTAIELSVRGDEHFNWLEDSRGFTVVRERGRFVYGKREATGRIVPSTLEVGKQDPDAAGIRPHLLPDPAVRAEWSLRVQSSQAPTQAPIRSGTLRNLVVLLRFANHTNRQLPTPAAVDVLFNRVGGDPALAPTGSVRDVYEASSYGRLALESTVVPYWIDLPYTEQYYAAGNSLGRTPEAIRAALDALDRDPSFSFRDFDRNGDGAIDAITFIHSGYGAEWGGYDGAGVYYADRIWSHKSSIGYWSGREGIAVTDYHISPALWGTSGSAIGRIGVISHELGHFLGLPDLYDSDHSGQGAGSWCLMANAWGFDGTQLYPPHMSAWSKAVLGWVTPTVITPGAYSLEAAERSPTVYRIDRGYAPGEYLLVENRQPDRFDARIPQGGLAVWHIDEAADFNGEGYPGQYGWPENGLHYRVALLQADGSFGLENGWNRGDSGDLYHAGSNELRPDTLPSTDSYQYGRILETGNELIEISGAGAVMDFTFSDGTTVTLPHCSDGIDNDRDGLTDFPSDPGCESAEDGSELDLPANSAVPIFGGSVRASEQLLAPAETTLRFKSTDSGILAPAIGSGADPTRSGARLVLSNPRTGEMGEIALPAYGWSFASERLTYAGESCSISLANGRSLSVRCLGSLGGFTLDEASQGQLDVVLELGEGSGFCASFGGTIARDIGSSMSTKQVGSFSAKGAPRPAACSF